MPGQPKEQRTLDWPALIDQALTMPGSTGDVYNRFRTYSFLNRLFLYSQGATEPVAKYQQWKDMGRQVLKDSKAFSIVRPITIEKKDAAGEVEDRILKFKVVKCLFQVSQTEGEPLPEIEVPGWDLDQALDKLDIKRVPFQRLDANVQGSSFERTIAVNPVAKYPFKTTVHEIGHVLLGHSTRDSLAEYEQHRGLYEFGAEATAHLTCNELGQLPDEAASVSRAYIQGWIKDERPSDVAIRQVFGATEQILKSGRMSDE